MKMVDIPGGTFTLGRQESAPALPSDLTSPCTSACFPDGHVDERPTSTVTLSPFSVAATEVTNAQYEQFDPSHKQWRGTLGLSPNDDDAVIWVSWEDATNYTQWLAAKEGKPYRLLTEAEWEFMAAGNDSSTQDAPFWTGDSVPTSMQKNQQDVGIPSADNPVNLRTAQFKPNGFGVYDTLGNVEEWVGDWYGPYDASTKRNPGGPASGDFRVTRGGSANTFNYFLRTRNRLGAVPVDRSWYVGFRVAVGVSPVVSDPTPTPKPPTPSRAAAAAATGASPTDGSPEVSEYVQIPDGRVTTGVPYSFHNHDPTVIVCPSSGDVLTVWFSGNSEEGREVGLASSRRPASGGKWPTATPFFVPPDRTQCCPSLYYHRPTGVLYHFSSCSAAGHYQALAGVVRTSTDCGLTWSAPSVMWPRHGIQHQIVVTTIYSPTLGKVLIPADHFGIVPYNETSDESVVQHGDPDDLLNPSAWTVGEPYTSTGSHHSSIVELKNGSFIAVGRGHPINGTMAMAYSTDGAHTWVTHPSTFPAIHGGQREVMFRASASDGDTSAPIVCCSFANEAMPVTSTTGVTFNVTGLYCAVSHDEGNTWPTRRTITDDLSREGRQVNGFDNHPFTMSYNSSEPNGYMDADTDADGNIHLITSRNHYKFSVDWASSKPPPPPEGGIV